jgi:cytochrome c-type biogenesis protein
MNFLQSLLESTQIPLFSAFLLGLMMAISPCPLAMNITAIGYISKDLENRRKVFYNGLIYTLGHAVSYTTIGLLFYFGASQFKLSGFFQEWGEKIMGPMLVLIGLFMLGILSLNFPGISWLTEKMERRKNSGFSDVLLLGMVFALAFCPYSGVLYFGMLIPMTISSASGLYLPIIFAIATCIPVIFFSWFIAFSLGSLGKFYNRLKTFEIWVRRVVAVLFIVVGIYYLNIFFI